MTPMPRRDPVTGLLLLAAAPLLVVGLVMPAISVTKLAFFKETYSVLDGVLAFAERGEWALFALLFVFTVLFPALKIVVGALTWSTAGTESPRLRRTVRIMAAASRWSMLDVFIVAVVVLVADGRLLASADVHIGVVLFAAAAIVSTVAMHRLARRSPPTADGVSRL